MIINSKIIEDFLEKSPFLSRINQTRRRSVDGNLLSSRKVGYEKDLAGCFYERRYVESLTGGN